MASFPAIPQLMLNDALLKLVPFVLTTEGGESMKKRGREVGATGWVVKPFDPALLREAAACALRLRAKALRKQDGGQS
jgi:two-component system chemotaxis response regulator CheY